VDKYNKYTSHIKETVNDSDIKTRSEKVMP